MGALKGTWRRDMMTDWEEVETQLDHSVDVSH